MVLDSGLLHYPTFCNGSVTVVVCSLLRLFIEGSAAAVVHSLLQLFIDGSATAVIHRFTSAVY